MVRDDEIRNPTSSLNTAEPTEPTFVLIARDPAAPRAIRAWVRERLRRGMNKAGDTDIIRALKIAGEMERQRPRITWRQHWREMYAGLSQLILGRRVT